jgi:type IV pilus assembly protein PilQ
MNKDFILSRMKFPSRVNLRGLLFSASFCILTFGFCISCGFAQNTPEVKVPLNSTPSISLDLKNAELKDVLKAFSIQAGMNFIASEKIKDRKLTLYLDRVSVKEAIDSLFKANNLSYEFDERAKIILVKEASPEIETITKIFPLKYARVSTSSIQEEMSSVIAPEGAGEGGEGGSGKWKAEDESGITYAIKGLLSKGVKVGDITYDGELIEDARTNSLIITDLPNRFPIIEKTIKELDVPVPQVMLEVEILDVKKNLVDKLGFKFAGSDSFGTSPLTLLMPGALFRHGARFFLGDLDKKGSGIDTSGVEGHLILGNTYAGLLELLNTQTDTKYLARPRILTLNNETAEIGITTDEAIGESVTLNDQGEVTGRTPERTTTGVSLRITPQVNLETEEITMFVVPAVTNAATGSFTGEGGFTYRDPEERTAKCLVKVRNGDTVVVGGLIRRDKVETLNKVPLLGDIPIIGALFRHKYKEKDVERELLVFITPHIVRDTFQPLAKESSMILSSREQGIPPEDARLLSIEAALNSVNVTQH